jgi:hypothetical protein
MLLRGRVDKPCLSIYWWHLRQKQVYIFLYSEKFFALTICFLKYGYDIYAIKTRALGATWRGRHREVLAPNVPIWERPKKDFLNNFLEVILQHHVIHIDMNTWRYY